MRTLHLPEFVNRWVIDHTRWLGLGIGVSILTLGYLFILANKIETVRTEGLMQRAESVKQLAADTAYRDALRSSSVAFQQKLTDDDLDTINDFIPTGSDFPTILLTVQDMATQSGLDLADISVTETGQVAAAGSVEPATLGQGATAIAQAATVAGVSLRTQDVTVTVNGIRSYEDVKAFVKVIETSRRLFDIIAINFNLANTTATGEGISTEGSPITFSLRTYYLPNVN